jgi:zinc transport system ATP-binding protein
MIPSALLALQQVSLRIGGRDVLQAVDLEVRSREIVTVVGPNGGGKTSLLRVALGLTPPSRGHVRRPHGLRIGYMPQRLHIDPSLPLTVERFLGLTGAKTDGITGALARVGASRVVHHPLQAISGGEWQRVLLARALLRKPDLLVLDEPAQGVDLHGQQELYHLLGHLRRETGCAILMVSHDLHLVMASTDRVVCLNGHVCCSGPADTVATHPEYLALFGQAEAPDIGVYAHHHDHHHDMHGRVVGGTAGHSCGDCGHPGGPPR